MFDPYVYPDTKILINKFNIKDRDVLKSMEADFTSSRLKDIMINGLGGDFDLEHLLRFHYTIFQDIYHWAGQLRIMNIEKSESLLGGRSIEYSDFRNIASDINYVLSSMKATKWWKLSISDIALNFAKYLSGLWRIHPFREGNTRTIITFCCHYATREGFPLDTDLLKDNSDDVRNALVAASAIFHDLGNRSNLEFLIKIIKDAIEYERYA